MVKNKINLSLNEPYIRQVYAKEGDSGRLYELDIDPTPTSNGTMRIKRPDGVEVTSPASLGEDITESGEVVSFDALEEVPLTKCEVTLESSQDLHGYENPWPSGGGENKFDPSVFTYRTTNGITFSRDGNDIVINNTATATAYLNFSGLSIPTTESYVRFMIKASSANASVTLHIEPSVGSVLNLNLSSAEVSGAIPYSSGMTFSGYLQVANGASFTDFHLSVCAIPYSSGTPTFAPYSNICPIYPSNGKNLLPLNNGTYTLGTTVTVTINDGVISFDGTATSGGGRLIALTDNFTLKAGTYYIKTNRTNAQSTPIMYINKVADNTVVNSGDDRSFTLTEDTLVFGGINLDANVNYTGATATPMLNKGTSATPYVPYQGINLYQVGKNLFDSNISNLINAPITLYGVSDSSVVNFLNTLEVGNYYLSFKETIDTKNGTSQHNYYGVIIANSATSNIVMRSDVSNPSQGDTFSFSNAIVINESNVGKFTNFWYYGGRATAEGTDTCTFHDFQLEKGTTATAYEPYNGTTYPLSLGQNVYGGKVDLVSGKLTVTHAIQDLGALSWGIGATDTANVYSMSTSELNTVIKKPSSSSVVADVICESYPTINADSVYTKHLGIAVTASGDVRVYDSNYNANGSQTSFKTAMNGVNLVYELATPTVIDLTPQQINTLIGENNLWASCGDVLEVQFAYDGMLSALPSQATEVVGRCIGDVELGGVSTMPFTLVVQKNNQGE